MAYISDIDPEDMALLRQALSENKGKIIYSKPKLVWKDNSPMTDEPQPNRKRLSPGRYPQYGATMKQTAIWLPLEMLDYLRAQPGTMSDYIRRLISDDMQKQQP